MYEGSAVELVPDARVHGKRLEKDFLPSVGPRPRPKLKKAWCAYMRIRDAKVDVEAWLNGMVAFGRGSSNAPKVRRSC